MAKAWTPADADLTDLMFVYWCERLGFKAVGYAMGKNERTIERVYSQIRERA